MCVGSVSVFLNRKSVPFFCFSYSVVCGSAELLFFQTFIVKFVSQCKQCFQTVWVLESFLVDCKSCTVWCKYRYIGAVSKGSYYLLPVTVTGYCTAGPDVAKNVLCRLWTSGVRKRGLTATWAVPTTLNGTLTRPYHITQEYWSWHRSWPTGRSRWGHLLVWGMLPGACRLV